jgi:hypothetical protein
LLAAILSPSIALATSFPGGNLPGNTTWTTADSPVQILGDLTIPNGVTLTVQPGVQLSMATTDNLGSGTDPNRVELIVANGGTLLVQGTVASPVTITTSGGSGAWYGVEVFPGGTATLSNAVVDKAEYDFEVQATLSLTNVTVQNASVYGLYAHGGSNITGTGCTFTTNASEDVSAIGGTTSIDHSLIENSSLGVYVGSSGSVTLNHDTIVNNTSQGVQVYGVTVGSTIRDSIIVNNGSYGIYGYGNSGTITIDHNDTWGQSTNLYGLSAGTGELVINPLFLGGGSFKLTSNSPCRNAASDGSDMGAFAYAGDATPALEGTLFTNTTLSGAQTVMGDLVIPAGVTLTLAAGTTLSAATSDGMAAGSDTTRVEIIVLGTLVAQGASGSGILLTTTGGSGAWYGVEVFPGGAATLSNAVVDKAEYDFEVQATLSLTNVTVQNASVYGLYAHGGSNITATGCTFTTNATEDISVIGGTTSIDHSLMESSSLGVYVGSPRHDREQHVAGRAGLRSDGGVHDPGQHHREQWVVRDLRVRKQRDDHHRPQRRLGAEHQSLRAQRRNGRDLRESVVRQCQQLRPDRHLPMPERGERWDRSGGVPLPGGRSGSHRRCSRIDFRRRGRPSRVRRSGL